MNARAHSADATGASSNPHWLGPIPFMERVLVHCSSAMIQLEGPFYGQESRSREYQNPQPNSWDY